MNTQTNDVNLINNDTTLDRLVLLENISLRAKIFFINAKLTSLNLILNHFNNDCYFYKSERHGKITEKEIISLCIKYNNIKFIDKEIVLNKTVKDFNKEQKKLLYLYFINYIQKLSIRSFVGMSYISKKYDLNDIINSFYSEKIIVKFIHNVGGLVINELTMFKHDMFNYIQLLNNLNDKDCNLEYFRMLIKTNFNDISDSSNQQIENVINDNKKLKIFTIISLLVSSGKVFSEINNTLFFNLFIYRGKQINNKILANDFSFTAERLRQIMMEFEKKIHYYFTFILNFDLSRMRNYNINGTKPFYVIDLNLMKTINKNEKVKFNENFYAVIFNLIYSKTHILLDKTETILNKNKLFKSDFVKNRYLIEISLYKSFDFELFLNDVYDRTRNNKIDINNIYLKTYLNKFYKNNEQSNLNDIEDLCKILISDLFNLKVNTEGYFTIKRTAPKFLDEYIYEALNEHGECLSGKEIVERTNEKYSFQQMTESKVKSVVLKQREKYISKNRIGVYGLRKWEEVNNNIKGGTLSDIAYMYLSKEIEPKHVSDIINYINQIGYKTYKRSIIHVLRVELMKRFVFYKGGYIGITSKKYSKKYIVKPTLVLKTWYESFEDYKTFFELNNKLPRINCNYEKETKLYKFYQNSLSRYRKGTLTKDKEELLRSFGCDLDKEYTRRIKK